MANFKKDVLLDASDLFKEFKGLFMGQFALQEIKTVKEIEIYYWTNDKGNAEVDFILDTRKGIIPVLVKAETNLQAESLKVYKSKFSPHISISLSISDYKSEGRLINLPLSAVGVIGDLI